jgi:hypothetical protein
VTIFSNEELKKKKGIKSLAHTTQWHMLTHELVAILHLFVSCFDLPCQMMLDEVMRKMWVNV